MLQICLFKIYLELLCMEELLGEVGVSRAAGQVQTSQCHPCLGLIAFLVLLAGLEDDLTTYTSTLNEQCQ